MSEKWDLKDYVEVADRIKEFAAKYPGGSLMSRVIRWPDSDLSFVAVEAKAYRDQEDRIPGVGLAWEPFPGRTPYTKDSELQNAETSAWGRAIVAVLASDTKRGIASANEVRNRKSLAPASSGTATSGEPEAVQEVPLPTAAGARKSVPPSSQEPISGDGGEETLTYGEGVSGSNSPVPPTSEGEAPRSTMPAAEYPSDLVPASEVEEAEGVSSGETSPPLSASGAKGRICLHLAGTRMVTLTNGEKTEQCISCKEFIEVSA